VRDAFFTNKALDLHAGFQTLLGAVCISSLMHEGRTSDFDC
jgi:hypothetical protein